MSPRADEVFIEDIAHALSILCRYGGHCKRFYSVAEHSILLSRHASSPNKLWALLHDAGEAYIVDVPRPLKRFLTGYREAEDKIMQVICERFSLSTAMPSEIISLDTAILLDERMQNMATAPKRWSTDATPIGVKLEFWIPEQAERLFLEQFHALVS